MDFDKVKYILKALGVLLIIALVVGVFFQRERIFHLKNEVSLLKQQNANLHKTKSHYLDSISRIQNKQLQIINELIQDYENRPIPQIQNVVVDSNLHFCHLHAFCPGRRTQHLSGFLNLDSKIRSTSVKR